MRIGDQRVARCPQLEYGQSALEWIYPRVTHLFTVHGEPEHVCIEGMKTSWFFERVKRRRDPKTHQLTGRVEFEGTPYFMVPPGVDRNTFWAELLVHIEALWDAYDKLTTMAVLNTAKRCHDLLERMDATVAVLRLPWGLPRHTVEEYAQEGVEVHEAPPRSSLLGAFTAWPDECRYVDIVEAIDPDDWTWWTETNEEVLERAAKS